MAEAAAAHAGVAGVHGVHGVSGGVRALLRLEGAGLFALAVGAYAWLGAGWGSFALLFLLPDLAMLAYLAGPRAGALAYNATHSLMGPLVLGASGFAAVSSGGPMAMTLQAGALIWAAHIGFDRMLGYGLKYSDGFGFTHLGRIGREGRAIRAGRSDREVSCPRVS